jgi:hypothetical protein
MRSADTRLAALQQAYDRGYPEIALMILGGSVRVYTRSPKSRPGWQVSDYEHPYPDGTAAVVLVDAFATDKPYGYYIVPIDEIKEIIKKLYDEAHPGRQRPVSPEATHAVVSPESVKKYRDKWRFYTAATARPAAKPEPEQKSAEPPAEDEVTAKVNTPRTYVREIDAAILEAAGTIAAGIAESAPEAFRAKIFALVANQLHHLASPKTGWVGTLPVPDRSEWR